jgi:hypothetical protein
MNKADIIQALIIFGQVVILALSVIAKKHVNNYIAEHKDFVTTVEENLRKMLGDENYTKDITYLNTALNELNKDLKTLTMQEVETFAININSKVHFTKDETIEEILKIIKEGMKC